MREHVGEGLIAREWFSFLWDVAGGDDFSWDVMIVHLPRQPGRFVPDFQTMGSRTGPWILIDSIIESRSSHWGVFQISSMPCLISNPDVHLVSTFHQKIFPQLYHLKNGLQ